MSCLMEALQDKRVRLQPECKKRLQDRIDMWSYAAKVHEDPSIYIYVYVYIRVCVCNFLFIHETIE